LDKSIGSINNLILNSNFFVSPYFFDDVNPYPKPIKSRKIYFNVEKSYYLSSLIVSSTHLMNSVKTCFFKFEEVVLRFYISSLEIYFNICVKSQNIDKDNKNIIKKLENIKKLLKLFTDLANKLKAAAEARDKKEKR